VEFLYTRAIADPVEENLTLEPVSIMSSAPLPPEKQAEIEDLARAIREAVDAEISELAANLATTDDAHLFGDNEFKIRALAHKIAAKAIEQHLAQKKLGRQSSLDRYVGIGYDTSDPSPVERHRWPDGTPAPYRTSKGHCWS
jgi:hypothetical protein